MTILFSDLTTWWSDLDVQENQDRQQPQKLSEVITSRWLVGKYVHWPKCSSSRFVSLVKGHIEPRTIVKTWEEHPIPRVVGRSINYDHAQQILLDSDCTDTDFPEKKSDNAPISGRLRKRVPNRIAADSSDDESVSPRGNKSENEEGRFRESHNVNDEEEEVGDEIYIPPTKEINISLLGPSVIMTAMKNRGNGSGGVETHDLEVVDEVVDEPPDITTDELRSTYSLEADRDDDEEVGSIVEDNTSDKKISKHSKSCLLCEDCAMNIASIADEIKSLRNFAHPASTKKLQTFEEFLESADNMTFMVAKFRCFSNTALTVYVNSCLRKILTDEMACNFNAKGSHSDGGALTKESYLNKNFLVLLIDTVVNSLPQVKTIPQANVEKVKNCAGAWFRNAKKRIDSRMAKFSSRGQSRPASSASMDSDKTSHTATTPSVQAISGRQAVWRHDNASLSDYHEAHYKDKQSRWSVAKSNETSPRRYPQNPNIRTPERFWRLENNDYYRYSPYSPYKVPVNISSVDRTDLIEARFEWSSPGGLLRNPGAAPSIGGPF
ncbi:Hypothetical predicted protein [Cloeon dipterum]|uniref:DUF4806 domain-containing protein n=1 Tax=Cloeon dipterum TaxID=197152 RepID=A0A8S1DLR0_9INSE|nr:Hypothetical predicted protein [Cloeon dipterum]